jgi:hypothetical protein
VSGAKRASCDRLKFGNSRSYGWERPSDVGVAHILKFALHRLSCAAECMCKLGALFSTRASHSGCLTTDSR